ncbi:GNAT family N-acetyltransferase [Microvirga soli]|uniref:GNAT family N-acetyltransferase n=1 Tax=Microvirga soli TaxID=1854496 RepID=UPI00191D89BC|nr:GNAT family N-acetyltransferase [Microvirga soli]
MTACNGTAASAACKLNAAGGKVMMVSLISEFGSRSLAASKTTTQVVDTGEGLTAILGEWRALQASYGRYPFTDATLIDAWWRIRGEKDGERLHIVTCRWNGSLVAIAPLSITRRHGLRFLRWAGGDMFDYCDSLAITDTVNHDLWNSVRKSGRFDVALLKTIRPETSTYGVLSAFARPARTSMTHAICFNDDGKAAWREQGKRSRFRRTLRKLEERGPIRFEVVREGPVPKAPFAALIQQKTAWAARLGKVGLFDNPHAAALMLQGIADSLAAAGNLHFSWLQCGDDIIAVHLGCAFGNKLYYYMPSYDLEWSDFSPGNCLLVNLAEWANRNGLDEMDFLRGGDAYKEKFANTSRELSDFTFPGSVIGYLAEPLLNSLLLSRSSSE